jgi:hypothetical protein
MCDSERRWPGVAFTSSLSSEGSLPRTHPPSADDDAPGGGRRAPEREYSYAATTAVIIIVPNLTAILPIMTSLS